jgi:hypothetical protein
LIFRDQDKGMILFNCYCYDNFNKKIISLRGFECFFLKSLTVGGKNFEFRQNISLVDFEAFGFDEIENINKA